MKVIAETAIKEMTDEKKAIHRYVLVNGPEKATFSNKHASNARRVALRKVPATNDNCKSALGGATNQIQQFGQIGIKHAAAVSDCRRNNWLHQGTQGEKTTKKKKERKQGLFWCFPPEVMHAIIQSAIEEAPEQGKRNNEELEAQRRAEEEKEQLIRELNLHNATEAYIDAIYYYKMYHSATCLKGITPSEVQNQIQGLPSKKAKLRVLKENLLMRRKGFGWKKVDIAWSKDCRQFTIEELTQRLIHVIGLEGSNGWEMPLHPHIDTPSRTYTTALGTTTAGLEDLDTKYLGDDRKLRKKARKLLRDRETQGEGSLAAECQPQKKPELSELVRKRIEVLTSVRVGSETALIWWTCEVVLKSKEGQTVKVTWDPLMDVKGWEKGGKSVQTLLKSKWRKDTVGAWRMEYNESDGDSDSDDKEDNSNSQ